MNQPRQLSCSWTISPDDKHVADMINHLTNTIHLPATQQPHTPPPADPRLIHWVQRL